MDETTSPEELSGKATDQSAEAKQTVSAAIDQAGQTNAQRGGRSRQVGGADWRVRHRHSPVAIGRHSSTTAIGHVTVFELNAHKATAGNGWLKVAAEEDPQRP